jgi:hypothetical protein
MKKAATAPRNTEHDKSRATCPAGQTHPEKGWANN